MFESSAYTGRINCARSYLIDSNAQVPVVAPVAHFVGERL